jgi:cytoskeletal protein CcmA (bactofilin family)
MAATSPAPAASPPGPLKNSSAAVPVPNPPPVPPAPLSGSLKLKGASRVPHVRALHWVARGFTKVVGDVEVSTGNVSGSLAVGGRLVARQLDLNGIVLIENEVRISEDLHATGTLRIAAGLSARVAELNGTVEIGGPVAVAELLRWKGSLEVRSDVRADTVMFQGRLDIQGTLTARSISGEIQRLSSVREIRADWVEIRRRKARIEIPVLPPPQWHELAAQRIEAKEVHLSGVRVRYVKADRIFLGPEAHVEYVEGQILQRHKEAHVGPESESPPPPGLSR